MMVVPLLLLRKEPSTTSPLPALPKNIELPIPKCPEKQLANKPTKTNSNSNITRDRERRGKFCLCPQQGSVSNATKKSNGEKNTENINL
mmetsp:Transcript_2273/g.8416  ORF Transcript_2273/g.8416 Transcript_2273/m.8416 type:complete len:89 (-) Transcript_2273:504-770(-)